MHPLETYLEELGANRGVATKETSGYGALATLLNAAGHTLKPKVRCIIHPKNSGAGLPDGGLFTPDQLKNRSEEESFIDQKPARGVIEIKSTRDEIADIAETEQVKDYLKHYGLVLLTNYRSFLLLKRSDNGKPIQLESFQLAPDEKTFWKVAAQPRKAANDLGERFLEYLKRVLLINAELNNPKDVAFFLASYARDARVRVEAAKDLPQLAAVRTALEEALGMKFTADKGEHFFRSTLVQTLFYGVFSAWVLWHKEKPQRKNDFDWKSAAWTLHVPMIKALFEQVATPTKLGPLGLVEVLDWTAAALNRVDRAAFFEKFLETTLSSISTNPSSKPLTPNSASNWAWGIKKFNLDDLYVRFFRIAERKIAEHTLPNEPLQGIVSFISNHSWISDPSFVVNLSTVFGWKTCMATERFQNMRRMARRVKPSLLSKVFRWGFNKVSRLLCWFGLEKSGIRLFCFVMI
jgi:hypothetical protein